MEQQLEVGQIILGIVEKISGTTVFVKIEGNGEGTLTTSEISPGRIRNLREYVVPGKKIVCKVLNLNKGIHLSLRRVKQHERKELLDKIAKEKSYKAILKTVLKEKSETLIQEITKKESILDFFNSIKEDPKELEKYLSKQEAEKIIKILETKKEKPKEIKNIIKISNKSSNGIEIIKKILQNSCKNSKCEITYLAAGKYQLLAKGEDFKEIKSETNQIIQEIEKQAKKQNCEFSTEKN